MKKSFLFFFILLSCSSSKGGISNISILQDKKGIKCNFVEKKKYLSLTLDRRDQKLILRYLNGQSETYESEDFLDRAVLMKSKNRAALFHHLEDGKSLLSVGRVYKFKESDCSDTGASKKCTLEDGSELTWSPEVLILRKKKLKLKRYGFFPNDATYFFAEKEGQSIYLIDYGSNIKLLSGKSYSLNCRYL